MHVWGRVLPHTEELISRAAVKDMEQLLDHVLQIFLDP